jgi:hypothetical protein
MKERVPDGALSFFVPAELWSIEEAKCPVAICSAGALFSAEHSAIAIFAPARRSQANSGSLFDLYQPVCHL